jgi:hypothetical protein
MTVDLGRTLRNESNAIWTSGNLRMLNAGLFHNAPGGTFEIRGDLTMEGTATGATPGSFRNDGTVRRTTTSGTATVLATFVNGSGGLFRGETGTVRFSRTLVNSGQFEFLPGTVVEAYNPDTNPAFNPKTFDASVLSETFQWESVEPACRFCLGQLRRAPHRRLLQRRVSLAARQGSVTHPDTLRG